MDKEDSKTLEYYKKQKHKTERNGNLKSQADACSVIGEIYSRYERYEEAIEEYQQELLLSEAENTGLSIALANRKLGECYCKKQLFDKAVPLHKRYLSLARECGNKVEEQRALATLGATYLGQCECETTYKGKREVYRLAEQSFIKGLEVTEEIKSGLKEVDYMDMKGRLYQNLGLLYDEMNNWGTSSQYFQKALAINKKYNLLENLFLCQSSLVGVYQKHGNMEEAKTHAELCVETARRMKSRENEAVSLMLKALILLQEREFHLSKHLLKKAHKIGIPSQKEKYEKCYKCVKILHRGTEKLAESAVDNPGVKIKLFDTMGDAAAELGLYKQAIGHYEKLLQASIDQKKEKKMIAIVHVSLAETLRDDRQFEKAIEHFKQEIDCRSDEEQDQVCRSWMNIGAIQELYLENYSQPQVSYVNAYNAAKIAKNRKLQVQVLENLVALFKYHKKSKQMETSKERLNQVLSKYHITDSELEEDTQDMETVEGDEEGDTDVSDMSDLTESEDEDEPANTVTTTTIQTGRTTKRKVIKRNLKGETPLHTACIDGKLQEVQRHLNQGHPVNVRDNGGWTPLHEASNFGFTEIVKLLIQHGGNVNDRGGTECSGLTPMMDAASNGMVECVKILMDAGASVQAKDDNMMTTLDHLSDYVERTKDEMTDGDKLEAMNMMDLLKDRMPFHRDIVPPKIALTQKSALIPESEARSFAKKAENKKRSRNDIIYDDLSDSDGEGHQRKSRSSPLFDTESQDLDDLYNPPVQDLNLEDNATSAYRNAMASIGSSAQRSSQVVKKSPKTVNKKTGLVAEEEYFQDDWLIDDMKPAAKRRKMEMDGYRLTSGLTSKEQSKVTSAGHRTTNRQKGSTSKRMAISDSEDESVGDIGVLTPGGNRVKSPVISEFNYDIVSSPERVSSPVPSTSDDFPVLIDFTQGNNKENNSADSGFVDLTRNRGRTNSFVKKSNKQLKLTDFGASVSRNASSSKENNESHNLSSMSGGNQSLNCAINTSTHTGDTAVQKVLKIKVQIQDKLLLVPVVDRDGSKTFSWLAEETASRYSRMFGLKPLLTLGTKDGAHFSPDDLIHLILTDGEKIEGFLQGWDLPTMAQQYISACKTLKSVMYKNIERLMKSCEEGTGCLNLTNLSLRSVRFQPILRAIQHQNCLRELELKGNQLGDCAVDSLSRVFGTFPNLAHLGLACNNITKKGLCHIAEAVQREKETSLKSLSSLDVSYNPLYDECQQQLLSVIKSVPTLTKLSIASCNLTADFFQSDRPAIAQTLNDSKLQHIDISYNHLGDLGVYYFLRCQNPTKIGSLNLSSTTTQKSSQLMEHLCDYVSQDGCVLQRLELRNLRISKMDCEQMMRFTRSASYLYSIDLSSNASLDNEVLRSVIQGSCHATSQLERLTLNNCGVTSPFALELLDVITEKLTMPKPLGHLQFTCHNLTELDFDSVKHIWKEKWLENADISKTGSSVKLSVVA